MASPLVDNASSLCGDFMAVSLFGTGKAMKRVYKKTTDRDDYTIFWTASGFSDPAEVPPASWVCMETESRVIRAWNRCEECSETGGCSKHMDTSVPPEDGWSIAMGDGRSTWWSHHPMRVDQVQQAKAKDPTDAAASSSSGVKKEKREKK